jgi:hypothetical protein
MRSPSLPLALAALLGCGNHSSEGGGAPGLDGGPAPGGQGGGTGGSGGSATGGTGGGGTAGMSGGGAGGAPAPDGRPPAGGPDAAPAGPPPSGQLVWPNEVSSVNSDPWLVQHHNEIQEIHPRFLLIDFANNRTAAQVMKRFEDQKAAMMEGTRYRGYSDPSAKPFMIYELAKLVDLTDNPIPAGWMFPNSTKMPRRAGGIDFGALFNQTYADYYAIPDPKNPSHNMTLCELVNAGKVNDVFVVFNKTAPDNNVPEILEYKQGYDKNDVLLPGRFDPCAGNGCFGQEDIPAVRACGRSLRIGFLEMTGILGNSMQVNGHNYEHIGQRAALHFNQMFLPFANFDMKTRYGAPFNDWYGECPQGSSNCITYPGPNAVTYSQGGTAPPVTIDPFNQGCGNAHFPPNGRQNYDQTNTFTVMSTCEHYGLHDGPDGKDLQTPYDVSKLAAWRAKYGVGPTGGAWYMYWFQSFPGVNNKATLPDGTPMKNWWVYLYY